jgi:hypothetical protein
MAMNYWNLKILCLLTLIEDEELRLAAKVRFFILIAHLGKLATEF